MGAFIISKRNFLIRRADASDHLIRKDYVGPISDEDLQSPIVQMAIKGGFIAVSSQSADKQLQNAKETADGAEADIRPDAKKEESEPGDEKKRAKK